jgi:hypothetical protein
VAFEELFPMAFGLRDYKALTHLRLTLCLPQERSTTKDTKFHEGLNCLSFPGAFVPFVVECVLWFDFLD